MIHRNISLLFKNLTLKEWLDANPPTTIAEFSDAKKILLNHFGMDSCYEIHFYCKVCGLHIMEGTPYTYDHWERWYEMYHQHQLLASKDLMIKYKVVKPS